MSLLTVVEFPLGLFFFFVGAWRERGGEAQDELLVRLTIATGGILLMAEGAAHFVVLWGVTP